MPDDVKLAKAELRELDGKFDKEKNSDKWVTVQFNPDTLKVSYANQIQQPNGSGDQRGPQTQQFVGAGSMKLAVQIYFDVTQALPDKESSTVDVRKLTQRVAYFITPIGRPASNPTEYLPPAIRFLWGSFRFDGIMESMEETLEYFSADGRPLRASLAIVLTQQKITTFAIADVKVPPFTRQGRSPVGTTPQIEAPENSSVQSLAGGANDDGGGGADWQTIAAANGIENPRLIPAGTIIDPSLRKPQIALE